jgi:hypothetical protein
MLLAMRAAVVGLVLVGIAVDLPLAAALRPLRERVVSAGAAAFASSWGDEVSLLLTYLIDTFSGTRGGGLVNWQLTIEQSEQTPTSGRLISTLCRSGFCFPTKQCYHSICGDACPNSTLLAC